MEEEIHTWLEDIQRSIDEIESFLPEKRNFFEFRKDLKTRKAVETNMNFGMPNSQKGMNKIHCEFHPALINKFYPG